MSTFAYLGTYGLTTTDDENYNVQFSIPDNCCYRSSGTNGQFCISIALNKGQTQPSSTFVPKAEMYQASKGGLAVDFDQPDQSGKRPKLVVVN